MGGPQPFEPPRAGGVGGGRHGPRRIGRPDLQIILDDSLGGDGRTVTFRSAERLRVVGLVSVYPADNRRVVEMAAGRRVLLADHLHARRFQGRKLAFGWPLPKSYVCVEAGPAVSAGVTRVLQPDGDREGPRIMGWAVLPFR